MNFDSFWTVWFWIAHVTAWSLMSHFAMGVPFDMIVQAGREQNDDGPWSTATDTMILAQVFRYVELYRKFGVGLVGVSTFILTVLLTLAIQADLELARAMLTILVPMTMIYAISIRTALRLDRQALRGKALRDGVRRQRFWNQLIGLLAIIAAVGLAIWEYIRFVQSFWV